MFRMHCKSFNIDKKTLQFLPIKQCHQQLKQNVSLEDRTISSCQEIYIQNIFSAQILTFFIYMALMPIMFYSIKISIEI